VSAFILQVIWAGSPFCAFSVFLDEAHDALAQGQGGDEQLVVLFLL
jgi:hypothetical protein